MSRGGERKHNARRARRYVWQPHLRRGSAHASSENAIRDPLVVVVLNRPPVVHGAVDDLDHAFDASLLRQRGEEALLHARADALRALT